MNDDAERVVPASEQMRIFLRMSEEEGLHEIIRLAIYEQIAYSEERMREIASGCLQWLAAAFTLPEGTTFLMFEGQVEQFLRLVVLDTAFFRRINYRYADYPFCYRPVSTDHGDIRPIREDIDRTIAHLRSSFGNVLDPELARWQYAHGHEILVPAGIVTTG